MNQLGLYIHIPFCERKCFYCDFLSFDNECDSTNSYINNLCKQIQEFKQKFASKKVKTIFIGGGTPSILTCKQLETLLSCINKNINMNNVAEFTIECNPNSLTLEKIKIFKKYKINRVSVGLQAWQDELLKTIGRIHTQNDFINAYNNLISAGITNINVDVMFSLPNQTMDMLKETLENVTKLNIKHISCYSLTLEDGTKMSDMCKSGELTLPDEILDREMHHYICDYLHNAGFEQYEISNFAKPGFESKHNLVYWDAKEYIGLGLGAHSYYKNERYHNAEKLEDYATEAYYNSFTKYSIEKIDNNQKYEEFMFLGLRKTKGISTTEFKSRFGIEIDTIYEKQIKELTEKKLLEVEGNIIKLTKLGIDVSNIALAEFLL